MAKGLAGWLLSGAVLGTVALVGITDRLDAAQIYVAPVGMLQWHLSVPLSVPPGAAVPGPGGLGFIGNGGAWAEHILYHPTSPTNAATGLRYDLTLTDVTYDFHDVDIGLNETGGGRARVQVTLIEAPPPPGPLPPNPTTFGMIPATGTFATNANLYPDSSGAGFPAIVGAQTTVLDSSTYFLFRDVFFDGALSGSAGTTIKSDGLAPSGNPSVTPLTSGANWLDHSSQGIATDCHNFQTGLFIPADHALFADIRVYNQGNPGNSPVTPISAPAAPGWVWIHLQGMYY